MSTRVLEALQMLLARYLFDPAVMLIDVASEPATGSVFLQVHVRSFLTSCRLGPPEEVNGIPVRVVVRDEDAGE